MMQLNQFQKFITGTVITLPLLWACSPAEQKSHDVPPFDATELSPGGKASVKFKPFPSFELPAANLPRSQRPDFHAGKALARQPWIKAPTATDARDGLGPVYNARTCLSCHINGGRGPVPADSETPLFAAFVRISIPGHDTVEGSVAEPVYGHQIQGQSISLSHQLRSSTESTSPTEDPEAPPEAYVYVNWQTKSVTYPDGQQQQLRHPQLSFERLGYGELHPQLMTSLRAAPALHGVGLLELIPETAINHLADPDDTNGDGISGRRNQVWDFSTGHIVPGRFGWKANRADLHIVTAGAFNGDVGITNPMFPEQPCTDAQLRCKKTPDGNNAEGVELPEHLLQLVINFTRNLGVPTRKGRAYSPSSSNPEEPLPDDFLSDGRALFYQIGCDSCHTPSYTTAVAEAPNSHLGEQIIWPYTDLLLHDMGPDLADNRPDYEASGSEWRTPPLWGIGLSQRVNGHANLLHDGRARSIEEAILWHGGEASGSQQSFMTLKKTQRSELIKFVESL